MSSSGQEEEETVVSFVAVTGADSATAHQYLEITNWNLNEAVTLYMESATHGASPPRPSAQMPSSSPPSASHGAPRYTDDSVRAPDPSMREQLVGFPSAFGRGGSSRRRHQEFQDFAAESIAAINAFASSSVGGMGNGHGNGTGGSASTSVFAAAFGNDGDMMITESSSSTDDTMSERSRDLRSLFQPPVGLMFHGTYSDARQHAADENKWLLVNVQDETVFTSHMLNRDTWSDDIVQNIVASGFVFWQTYLASDHGRRFLTLYQLDAAMLPLILILNPRTGEKVIEWTGFIGPQDLTEKLSDFCCSYSLEEPPQPQHQQPALGKSAYPAAAVFAPRDEKPAGPQLAKKSSSMMDMSEDDQLAAAIAASLEDGGDGEQSFRAEAPRTSTSRSHEQEIQEAEQEEKKAEIQEEKPLPALAPEPAQGSADATRVQIRFPDGSRVVRRFLKTDAASNLWSFVLHHVPEARSRPFELRTSFPPSVLEFNENESIADRKLENAALLVQWTT